MKKRLVGRFICAVAAGMMLTPVASFAADDLASAFSEGIFSGSIRYFDWWDDFDETDDSSDGRNSVFGGFVSFETAPLSGITAGLGFKFVQDVTYDDGYGAFYGLAIDGEESWSSLSEYYLRYNGHDTVVTVGGQYLDTPYASPNDYRQIPHSFEGVTLSNTSLDKFEFSLGYLDRWEGWPQTDEEPYDEYEDMAPDGGGMAYGGVAYEIKQGMDVNLWYYNLTDSFQIITPQFTYFKFFNRDLKARLDLRYAKFDSVGDELSGDYDTYTAGFIGLILWKQFNFVFFGQMNGDQSPNLGETFGNRRALTMTSERTQRAEEKAASLKVGYTFTGALEGLSAGVRYGMFDTPDDPYTLTYANNDLGLSQQDQEEWDFEVSYSFKGNEGVKKFFQPLTLTLKYALIDRDQDQLPSNYYSPAFPSFRKKAFQDEQQVRFYVYYDF